MSTYGSAVVWCVYLQLSGKTHACADACGTLHAHHDLAHPELSRVRAGTTEDDRHSVWTEFAAATRPSVDFFALERAFSSWLFTHVDAERLSRTSADHRGRSVCVGSAWKKVADLRDLCYGYAHSQCFSRRRPP